MRTQNCCCYESCFNTFGEAMKRINVSRKRLILTAIDGGRSTKTKFSFGFVVILGDSVRVVKKIGAFYVVLSFFDESVIL